MYDHVGLKVSNLGASVRFYTAALAPLGCALCSQDAAGAGFGPEGAPALWLSAAKDAPRAAAHVAFRAHDRAAVEAFYKAGIAELEGLRDEIRSYRARVLRRTRAATADAAAEEGGAGSRGGRNGNGAGLR